MLRGRAQATGGSSARIPPGRVLLVACFGAFLAFLDATVVNVAFPSIRESFPTVSIGGLSWVLNAYNIVFAAFLIVFGRLTDLIGRRRSFIGGVAVFTLGSALCGAAPTVDLLVAFRVVQALGAAALVPASLALVIAAFPGERRAHAIGLWGASAAVAAGLGPPIGGALTELGGWRWAFLVNLPFGLAALWSARRQLVESRAPGRRTVPDLAGAATLAASLALLNLGIVKGSDWGWLSAETLASFAVAAVLFAGFVLSSRRHRSPLIDPTLLRLRSFDIGSVATVIAGFGFYAYLLTNILWLQYVWGYDVLHAGLALVPGAVVAAIVASRLGPLAERFGYRWFVVPGAVVWACAYLWYHQQVGLEPAFWSEWMPGQILSGIGVGATLPLLGSASLAAVPGGRYATASAVNSSARQLGGVLGIAVLVVVLGNLTPQTAVAAFRQGWVLSIVAFLVVALVAIPLGRIRSSAESEEPGDSRPPKVFGPTPPPDWAAARPVSAMSTDVGDVPLLAALPEAARRRVEDASRLVEVAAGQDLVRQGDPAASAFVVRRGRLEVFIDGRRVRELGPGAVLGELALLTGEPRSATVRARRDATVLELPRAALEAVLESDAHASRFLLGQMAERLRTAAPPSAPPPERPSVVSVVAAHRGAPVDEVASALTARMAAHLDAVAPGRVDPDGLARAELEHDRVILVAGGVEGHGAGDRAWQDFCVRQADTVVLVARSDAEVPEVSAASVPSRRPEVVLVGPAPPPERRAAWGAATDAWQVTVAEGDVTADVRALADRLCGRSLGVVLAGGAARAFASIGVLRELEDSGLRIDRLAGTSMGAVVAAAYATSGGGEAFEEVCYAEFVRRNPFSDWAAPVHALAKGIRARQGLIRGLGETAVFEGLSRQLRVVSVDLTSRVRQVHERGGLVDAVLASSRLPVLFPPLPQEDGRLLVDGSVLDNLPADLLVERDEGPVVAVSIGTGGSGQRRPGRPKVPSLGDTLLRTMTIGSGGAIDAARRCGAWVVAPSSVGTGLLEFHQFDRMVEAGRVAARALLEQAGDALGDVESARRAGAAPGGSESALVG
ncbi:MFS transporter [Isoptericola sp. b441]|uniref:MFS transporter n=1 Tax=Actinotalea lenta TaxID=3064654 RepID=A0ABT9D9J8_9CELL|nr:MULTISPECIES: MFS transporter [unclassified Isoptericola]MDO8105853.1 MFS transporter [Isoptericola sp. b441]MDO8122569.1 MFS transporter [Isoptericola sp. b490]